MIAPHEEKAALWSGTQGVTWVERNPKTPSEIDALYLKRFGITRTMLNIEFIGHLAMNASFLEVGCSSGAQLRALQTLGYHNLHGVDVNAESMLGNPFPHETANMEALPFPDASFDVVFTSGTLMHVPPSKRPRAVQEMARVSRRWLWGFEYWSATPKSARFTDDFLPPLWVEDFAALCVAVLRTWRLSRSRIVMPVDDGSALLMYLLERA